MIKLIEKVIREELPDMVGVEDTSLSFLKFSTPTSGEGPRDKVIFLVFKDDEALPFLCVKTVRTYTVKKVIEQNFENLKKLNTLTKGSPYDHLFTKALYLHDDGEEIFSIETACKGKRMQFDKEKLDQVVEEYISFQEYMANQTSESLTSMAQFMKEIVGQSSLTDRDKQEMLEYMETLSVTTMKLPRIVQHGDLSDGNILLTETGIGIIDYDFVHITDLPGLDLYGLIKRYSRKDAQNLYQEYFPKYFERIGADLDGKSFEGLFFLYYFIENVLRKPRNLGNRSSDQIIADFTKDSVKDHDK